MGPPDHVVRNGAKRGRAEWLASIILEPYGDLVDDLGDSMVDTETDAFQIDGSMPIRKICALIKESFGWALSLDWAARENCARAWYVSVEKSQPRLGERFDEPIAIYEQPLAPARDAVAAYAALGNWNPEQPLAEFLLCHPEHRHTVRRAQISASAPFGEIHDNTIAADMLPIDLLRAKLSYFGATRFDPRLDRWLRICMFADAPYPDDLTTENSDLWVYPEVPA